MKKEHLLVEVDDILRTMPSMADFEQRADDLMPWIGRAAAAIRQWNFVTYGGDADRAIEQLHSSVYVSMGFRALRKLLFQASADLRMEAGQLSVVVRQGQVFDYFDELRKVIETARVEVFFVDAYLDAEFVPRYLPHVADGATIRLLGGPKKMSTLLPSVDVFVQQYQRPIQVRTSTTLHDRYLFVDQIACYLSGASFKDGAKNAPAVLTQVTDAFPAMWATYDALWQAGKMER